MSVSSDELVVGCAVFTLYMVDCSSIRTGYMKSCWVLKTLYDVKMSQELLAVVVEHVQHGVVHR
jgi:hypothetical protein